MEPAYSHRIQSESDVRSIQSLEDNGFSCCELFFPEREPLDAQTLKLIDEVSGTTNLLLTAHLPFKNINIASVYQYVKESSVDMLSGIIDSLSDYVRMVTVHTGYASPSVSGGLEKAIKALGSFLGRTFIDRIWFRADVARLTQERDDWKLNAQVAHMERDVAQARVAERERRRKEREQRQKLFKIVPLVIVAIIAVIGVGFTVYTNVAKPPRPANAGVIGPRMEVDREQLDLGNRKLNEQVRAAFTIKNSGDDTLNLGVPQSVTALEGC